MVVHNDKLITFAGWNGKKKLNDMFQYNLDSQTFQMIHESDENDPRLPCRRECHTSVVVNNKMLLFGGRFRGLFMNDICEFDLDVTQHVPFLFFFPFSIQHWFGASFLFANISGGIA